MQNATTCMTKCYITALIVQPIKFDRKETIRDPVPVREYDSAKTAAFVPATVGSSQFSSARRFRHLLKFHSSRLGLAEFFDEIFYYFYFCLILECIFSFSA